jgi:hypothetical protein
MGKKYGPLNMHTLQFVLAKKINGINSLSHRRASLIRHSKLYTQTKRILKLLRQKPIITNSFFHSHQVLRMFKLTI